LNIFKSSLKILFKAFFEYSAISQVFGVMHIQISDTFAMLYES